MRRLLLHPLVTAILVLILTAPIAGLVLDGYTFNLHWQPPLGLALTALILHLVINLVRAWRSAQGGAWSVTHGPIPVPSHPALLRTFRILLLLSCLVLPFLLNKYWLTVAILALIYVLLALGLNIVVGLAGMLDLGFVAFYAVGAYGYALGHEYLGLGFWSALPLGAFLAAGFGVVLGFPVLRMHGDYLAIVTLGFGEIIRLVLNNWTEFTGGPNGVRVAFPSLPGLEFSRKAKEGNIAFHEWLGIDYSANHRIMFMYLILFLVVLLIMFLVTRLKKMPLGRSWEALREDEIACRSLGINHVTVKLSAFAMGAMIGGIGGVFFAASQGFVNPTSFTFFESALILAIVVLGGLGSIPGVIIAAIVLTVLPELLRDFSDYRILVFGLAMVGMMIWRPRGLVRARRPVFQGRQG
ncbi:MAG: high-affinity branched-chain amino acid ABC transporter permease LivM [Magnetococcales bacterium]|nr:high-affinity branched-chain amino acid ABC transporter permease LivM [Magnetococcales bacterium]MBF0150419.1 high-affinity branched-chain amino acid ABC transporter permease LivM [Magnetococcales bacterium]MBF0173953.1 high-affinity branched-chain amino acid ABC transporter permease LivM [Magnetococcales bacterium]MBF0632137.1 high-affinity branched-chain amino acid ABC transporter permease LivM [Magnetococcales bacterium]